MIESTPPPAIAVTDLRVRFGGLVAIADVGFELLTGQVLALIGPNGAGKTTLLNAAGGLLGQHVSGRVEIAGHDCSGMGAASVAELGVCRSFQHPPLLDVETVLTNAMVGGYLSAKVGVVKSMRRPGDRRRFEAQVRERAMQALEFVGIAASADHTAGDLSYGKQKLVDIARALTGEPSLLMLDEPTSGLDRTEQEYVIDVLAAIRARGITAIIVEHHMHVVRRVCDQVLALEAGRSLMQGPPDAVLDAVSFVAAITGEKGKS